MSYYGAKELAASFRTVRKNTIKIAEEIEEQHYGFRAAPETRTVAQMLTHIALATRFPLAIHSGERVTNLLDFDFQAFLAELIAEDQISRTKDQILALLREEGDRFATWLDTVSDDLLSERLAVPMQQPPASKSRFEMILGAKEHEMHHRAQLMLIQRMTGVVPHLTRESQARMEAMKAARANT